MASQDRPLLEFLLEKLAGQSATSVKRLMKHRCVFIRNEAVSQFDRIVRAGEEVTVMSQSDRLHTLGHPKLRIIYEDGSIIAVEKSSGLHTVDATHGGCDNACAILEAYVRRVSPGSRIYVVHRLDRDTSGVMIFAKTREAQNRLVKNWSGVIRERAYVAIVEGKMPARSGTIDTYLYEDARKVMHSTDDPAGGLRAVTHYVVLESNDRYSRVRLDLETGRTNQIRVHLKTLGHPVIGDEKYGSTSNPIGRLGLHAMNIRFAHPMTGREMAFSSPEPEEFGSLLEPQT